MNAVKTKEEIEKVEEEFRNNFYNKKMKTIIDPTSGSEKQVEWAEGIKLKIVFEAVRQVQIRENAGLPNEKLDPVKAMVEKARLQTNAKFWIDNRNLDWQQILRLFA